MVTGQRFSGGRNKKTEEKRAREIKKYQKVLKIPQRKISFMRTKLQENLMNLFFPSQDIESAGREYYLLYVLFNNKTT